MWVGHGMVRLPVRAGEPMGGYADRAGGVAGEHDPLEVHAVSFRAGHRRFMLVVCDLVCVNTDLTGLIRRRLRPLGVSACWVAGTHTHAGPDSDPRPGGGTTRPGLAARVAAAARQAAGTALATETGTSGAVARALVDGLAGVRGRAGGRPTGDMLPVDTLAVYRHGTLAGLLVVLPVHPTVLPAGNRRASADLTGGLRRALRRLHSGPNIPWVVVATGAAGNVSTRYTRRDRSPAETDRLGTIAASAIHTALWHAEPVWTPTGSTMLRGPVARTRWLDPKRPTDVAEPALAAPAADRTAYVRRQGSRLGAELLASGRREPYPLTLETVRLGALRLAAIPAEPYLSIADRITTGTPGPTLVLGYTNGYLGYLPDRAGYASSDYEALASPVRPGGAETVAADCVELLAALDTGPDPGPG